MQTVGSITVHNSCKKLAQLHSVIAYLQARLEDILFQKQFLESVFNSRFDGIVQSHREQVAAISSQMVQAQAPASSAASKLFVDRQKELDYQFRRKCDKIQRRLQTEETALSNEISGCKSAVFIIRNIFNQFISGVCGQNSDLSTLKSEVAALKSQHAKEKKKFDRDMTAKLDALKAEELKRQKELEAQFYASKLEAHAAFHASIARTPEEKTALRRLLAKRKELARDVEIARKELLTRRTVSEQNFHAFKIRLRSAIDKMKDYQAGLNAETARVKAESEQAIRDVQKEIVKDRSKIKQSGAAFENQKTQMGNAAKMARGRLQDKIAQTRKKMERLSSGQDMKAFQDRLAAELVAERERLQQIESQVSERESEKGRELRSTELDLIARLELIRRQSVELERAQSDEIGELEAMFGSERESLAIVHRRNLIACDKHKELGELQALLASVRISTLDAEGEIGPEQPLEVPDGDLDMIFRARESECKERIQQVSSEIRDEQLKCEKDAHEATYRCLEEIGQTFRNETVIGDMVRSYQAEMAKLAAELEAPDPPLIMPELEPTDGLERELSELVTRIENEKESLTEDFENQFRELEAEAPRSAVAFPAPDESERESLQADFSARAGDLDREISELITSLADVAGGSIYAPLDASDGLDELRNRLNDSATQSQSRLAENRARTGAARKELQSEILACRENTAGDREHERRRQQEGQQQFSIALKAEMTRQSEQQQFHSASLEKAAAEHTQKFEEVAHIYEQQKQGLLERIEAVKAGQEEPVAEVNRFDGLMDQKKRENETALAPLREARDAGRAELSALMERKEKAEAHTESLMSIPPRRPQEQMEIDKLEVDLKTVTADLRRVGRDFLDFRASLVMTDREVNQRFGAGPNIPVGHTQDGRNSNKRKLVSFRKPLPPLSPFMGL
jgi:hypothetical protein